MAIADKTFPLNRRLHSHLIGVALRDKRLQNGESQSETAAKLNLTTSEYRQIESGLKFMDSEKLNTLWSAMGLDVNEFVNINKVATVRYLVELYKEWDESATD